MNELIQALLLQSKNPNTGMVEEEKFAELIVKQCANIVRNSSLPDSYSEACLEYIADELEEHFGVEP